MFPTDGTDPTVSYTVSDRIAVPAEHVRTVLERHRAWIESAGREGERADLSERDLSDLDLTGANLASARLNGALLRRTRLNGADLSGAHLCGAQLARAELNLANLTGARLTDANLTGAEMCRADLSGAYLERARLQEANLDHACLAHADLSRAELSGANLRRAALNSAVLSRAKLPGARLARAGLASAELEHVDLSGADLSGADLTATRLHRANLWRADLQQADLSGANLTDADLTGAKLKGARLANADLRGARVHKLDQTYVRGAQFSAMTPRWRAFLCDVLFGPLTLWLTRRGWPWAAERVSFVVHPNDEWSVLRQSYAGPRVLFLFFTVIAFALPYAGRAVMYSSAGPIGREAHRVAEARKRQLDARLAANPHDATAREEAVHWNEVLQRLERKPVWKALLHWETGRIWPAILAGFLLAYNVGVYQLIVSVSALRDEEERSGWTPRWRDYAYLVLIHRVVVILFYVSVASFLINITDILTDDVFIPKR